MASAATPPRSLEDCCFAVAALREELASIRDCLLVAGLLRAEDLLAQQHRRHFVAACATHPCAWGLQLPDALAPMRGAAFVAACAGAEGVRPLRAASPAVLRLLVSTTPVHGGGLRGPRGPRIAVCGGRAGKAALSSVECFDLDTCAWEALPPMLEGRTEAFVGVAAGSLHVCGGGGPGAAERYLPSRGAWEALAGDCWWHDALAKTAVAGRVHRTRGWDDDSAAATAEGPVASGAGGTDGLWEALLLAPQRRAGAAAALLGGRAYLCGGLDTCGECLNSVERFDSATGDWEALPPLPRACTEAAAASLDGRLYVCGGLEGQDASAAAERFDPAAGAWEPLPSLAQARYSACAAAVSSCLLVAGGYGAEDFALRSMEFFDQDSWAWEKLAPMSQQRAEATVTVVAGRLYVCGGSDFEGNALSSVERYDPVMEAWETMPPMQQGRALGVGAVLAE